LKLFQQLWAVIRGSQPLSAQKDLLAQDTVSNVDLFVMASKAVKDDPAALDYLVRLGATTDVDRRKRQIDALVQWLVFSAVTGDTKQVFLGGARCAKCGTGHSFTLVKTESTMPCTKCKTPIRVDWWKLPPLAIEVRLREDQAAAFLNKMG
jgi:hypothetical protein